MKEIEDKIKEILGNCPNINVPEKDSDGWVVNIYYAGLLHQLEEFSSFRIREELAGIKTEVEDLQNVDYGGCDSVGRFDVVRILDNRLEELGWKK